MLLQPFSGREPLNQRLSIDRNRRSANDWQRYQRHRNRVTEGLIRMADRGSDRENPPQNGSLPKKRLIVLGAGNANDLDLAKLEGTFDTCMLVDWDVNAMEAGVASQADQFKCRDWIELSPSLDLSQNNIGLANALAPMGTFDVVASIGLMSQLIEANLDAVDSTDAAQVIEKIAQTRLHHFRLIRQLMDSTSEHPPSTAYITTEVVSSETLPELNSASADQAPSIIRDAVQQGNFFTGLQPASVIRSINEVFNDPQHHVEIDIPWTWDFGPRVYAVVAYQIRLAT